MGWTKSPHYQAPYRLGQDNDNATTDSITAETSPPVWTWGTGVVWSGQNKCLKYYNDTDRHIVFTRVVVNVVSCNSGGQGYWAFGGYVSAPCNGYSARYHLYLVVEHTASNMAAYGVKRCEWGSNHTSQQTNQLVPAFTSANYITLGSSGTNTAQFGGLRAVTYNLKDNDMPIVHPGDTCYLMICVHDFGGPLMNTTIRICLDPDDMTIDYEEAETYYVWKYFDRKDGKGNAWHLVRPAYMYGSKGWDDIEKVIT